MAPVRLTVLLYWELRHMKRISTGSLDILKLSNEATPVLKVEMPEPRA